MRIALAQFAATTDRDANVRMALEYMERAAAGGAGLMAFAELAVERFFPQYPGENEAALAAEPIPGPTADRIAEQARRLSLVTVFNMYERDSETGHCFDSSPAFDADGSFLGVTRMVHITDYACFHERDYYHVLGPRMARRVLFVEIHYTHKQTPGLEQACHFFQRG